MLFPLLISCEYVPLTEEQQKVVDSVYATTGLEKDVVVAFGAAADSIYGASSDGNTAFSEDHQQSSALLQEFYEEKRIQGFDPAKHPEYADSAAVLMRNFLGTPTYIGINIETYTDLDPYELIHESAHALQKGHDPSLEIILEGASLYSLESAEEVLAVCDFPYLLTFLYLTADRSLYYNQYSGVPVNETKEEWAQQVATSLYDAFLFLPLLGITQEEYQTILLQSDFYELQDTF